MKKIVLMTVLVLVGTSSAFANPVSGNVAQTTYQKLRSQPRNDGSGVVSKSGSVACLEVGIAAPFKYRCTFDNVALAIPGKTAKTLFDTLSRSSQVHGGEGVVERSDEIYCSRFGVQAPFKYFCSFEKD